MTETRTCNYCGRSEAEHPELKWHSRNQCSTCHIARRRAKLEDENLLKTCKQCGRTSTEHPEMSWNSRTQCWACCNARRKEKLEDETVLKTCKECGSNSRDSPELKWRSKVSCEPCARARSYGEPWQRAWHSVRSVASKSLGGMKHIPESLNNLEAFKAHIEANFYSRKMSWERFGVGRGKWQIDHILPVSDYDPEIHDPETYFGIFNLQGLFYRHNMAKSNLEPEAVSLAIEADRLLWSVEDLPSERKAAFVQAAKRLMDDIHQKLQHAIHLTNEEHSKCQNAKK